MKFPTFENQKPHFIIGLIIVKVNLEHLETYSKINQKLFYTPHCLGGHSNIEDCESVIFEQFETHVPLEERETFWQHRLKTFYPIGLMERRSTYVNTKIVSKLT